MVHLVGAAMGDAQPEANRKARPGKGVACSPHLRRDASIAVQGHLVDLVWVPGFATSNCGCRPNRSSCVHGIILLNELRVFAAGFESAASIFRSPGNTMDNCVVREIFIGVDSTPA